MQERTSIEELKSYANALLREVGSHSAVALSDRRGPRPFRSWLRTPRAVAASIALVVFGNAGMAVASDSAIPGDLLYPLDRAYERVADLVGLQVGGPQERLDEAVVALETRGPVLATQLVAESLEDIDANLSQDLQALAMSINEFTASDEAAVEVRELVTSLTAAARNLVDMSPNADFDQARAVVRSRVADFASVVSFPDFTPPGQDDEFVPPGQDDEFVPPGQDDEFVPPGQDDEFVPPGQDDEFVPPGQDDEFVPPGQDDEFTPPGPPDAVVPPGRGSSS
jgi:hypothetical protein